MRGSFAYLFEVNQMRMNKCQQKEKQLQGIEIMTHAK